MLCLSRLILYQHILNSNKFILYPRQFTDNTYSRLVSFYYAAAHCTKIKGSGTLSLDTKDLLQEATRKLIGGKETNSIGTGAESLMPSILIDKKKPIKDAYTFKDVKEAGAVGSVPSLMFWTPDQKKILFEHHPRSIIYGQYGTGKTVLLTEKIKRMIQSIIDDQDKPGENIYLQLLYREVKGIYFTATVPKTLNIQSQFYFIIFSFVGGNQGTVMLVKKQ